MISITKPETKAKTVGIALTQTDYDAIKDIAEKHDMKVSMYLREFIRQKLLKKKGG